MSDKSKDVSQWWADNPMTYGEEHGTTDFADGEVNFGTRSFFERADKEFLSWNKPLHDETGPFGRIFPYREYNGKRVLEIGCGMGGMASFWARAGARITAVDLNPVAVEQTRNRFDMFDLEAEEIRQVDARILDFDNASFDYVYSWGVLHHSPDINLSLSELFRVLKPGGEFGLMLYNRRSLGHYYSTRYVQGILHGETRFLDELALASRYGDGHRQEGNPHTWPMTHGEIQSLCSDHAEVVRTRTLGTEIDSGFFLFPGLARFMPRFMKKAWARRFGWSIWAWGKK